MELFTLEAYFSDEELIIYLNHLLVREIHVTEASLFHLRVETNLRSVDREKVAFGPYRFANFADRRGWIARFKLALVGLNQEAPQEIKAHYVYGAGQFDENELMNPPEPEEAVRNLRLLLGLQTT